MTKPMRQLNQWEDIDLAIGEVDVNKSAFHIRSEKKVGIKLSLSLNLD